jgi:hypothetical protein
MTFFETNDVNHSLNHGSSVMNTACTSSPLNFRSSTSFPLRHASISLVPHRGSLCRFDGSQGTEIIYTLEIILEETHNQGNGSESHELVFTRKDFEFALRLFSIMDTESRGQVSKPIVQEFVTLRCPVFWRRDDDFYNNNDVETGAVQQTSPTFEEVWRAVACCSVSARPTDRNELATAEIGVEGWMVFCRFIALAQYLEAKRRFSGRHLQQTMRHRNSPRGSEVVVIDVPPAVPPVPLTAKELALYEQVNQKCLPLPELDLDHSLLAAHDIFQRRRHNFRKSMECQESAGHVKIDLFGPSSALLSSSSVTFHSIDFCLTYFRGTGSGGQVIDSTAVRRSMNDMKWLNDTFVAQKSLGGTLCGRILPPFPGNRALGAHVEDLSLGSATGGAIAAAANAGVGIASVGVGMLKEGFKSLWGGYSSFPKLPSVPSQEKKSVTKPLPGPKNTIHTYYNPNSPVGQARHLERYLNFLLEHPALSTSFPLNTILKVQCLWRMIPMVRSPRRDFY